MDKLKLSDASQLPDDPEATANEATAEAAPAMASAPGTPEQDAARPPWAPPRRPPIDLSGSRPLLNPYLAGTLLGLTLLFSFLTLGAGLGASGGLSHLAAWLEMRLAPARVLASAYFGQYGSEPLAYYLVFMLGGIFVGGLFSALAGDRIRVGVERGAAAGRRLRLTLALAGGVLVGFSSRLAQGCTSGQALTGGALLLMGSLVFTACIFIGGYATAGLFRRQWHD